MAEIAADHDHRIWFGHEYASGARPEQVAAFAEALGPRLHVVLTLRSLTRMLPSIWQEFNKSGNTGSFDGFVKRMFLVPEGGRDDVLFHIRHNHAGLVRRWAAVVGIENVTVVVADPSDHSFIKHAFEDLLDLPRDLIATAAIPPRASNRTMSAPEIELVRQINQELRRQGLPWRDYDALMLRGGVSRMLTERRSRPGRTETAVVGVGRETGRRLSAAGRGRHRGVGGAHRRRPGRPAGTGAAAQFRQGESPRCAVGTAGCGGATGPWHHRVGDRPRTRFRRARSGGRPRDRSAAAG